MNEVKAQIITTNATVTHPYLVREESVSSTSNLSAWSVINSPLKSERCASNVKNEETSEAASFCEMRSQTTPYMDSFGNLNASAKCRSFVTMTRFSDSVNEASLSSERPLGLKTASIPCCVRDCNSFRGTFSSSRNFGFVNPDDNVITSSGNCSSITQSCLDLFFSQWSDEMSCDFLNRHPTLQQLKNLPDHNTCSFERRFAVANFTVRNDVLVDFNSHNSLVANELYKGYGRGRGCESGVNLWLPA